MRRDFMNGSNSSLIVDNSLTSIAPSSYSWTPASEMALFQEMISHKPAGINKHFAMAVVSEKLSSEFGKNHSYNYYSLAFQCA